MYGGGTSTTSTGYPGAFSNYPSQWAGTENIYNYLASNTPWQTDLASQTAANTAQTGDIVSANPWYQQAVQQGWYQTQDDIKNAAEQAGLGGTRWSTPLGRTAQDIAGRRGADLATQYMALQGQYATDAANRKLTASSQLQGIGNDVTSNLQNVAQGLQSLGGDYFNAPINLANSSYAMGQQNQQTTQSALDKYYQEFLRTAAENNPYLAMIYQMATGQGTAQQYTSGTWSQLLNILGSLV
jgi:hypothetical protein